MEKILCIDPGSIESAYVIWDGVKLHGFGKIKNGDLMQGITLRNLYCPHSYIEMVQSYGMPVGKEVFETVLWTGRYFQELTHYDYHPQLIYRKDIKIHHCSSLRANDSNIMHALMDKYGDKGTKKKPGIFYGVSKDVWAAIALATYITETNRDIY